MLIYQKRIRNNYPIDLMSKNNKIELRFAFFNAIIEKIVIRIEE